MSNNSSMAETCGPYLNDLLKKNRLKIGERTDRLQGLESMRARLDRIVATSTWVSSFPNFHVEHVESKRYNHFTISLHPYKKSSSSYKPKNPFKF